VLCEIYGIPKRLNFMGVHSTQSPTTFERSFGGCDGGTLFDYEVIHSTMPLKLNSYDDIWQGAAPEETRWRGGPPKNTPQ
jgi:hypothetical protein